MATVELGWREVAVTPLMDGGLPVLDDGLGRLIAPAEAELLEVGTDHAERPPTILPYTAQARYGREPRPVRQRVATLTNERLRAEVLLDLGGRLWTLTDLRDGRELLHQPDAIQLANLALRNAWFAGGVEWNLGVTGHWPLTCTPVSAAVVERDGVQILRLWAYERILELIWRVEMWLPEQAEALYVHVTLHNPHADDRPVYWWSNTAVPLVAGTRVLVDAESAFHFAYEDLLARVPVPGEPELSRPAEASHAGDWFFEIDAAHPWIAAVDESGRGLLQVSTARLRGRKLFVWGTGPGGSRWQEWLSGRGAYTEIQAGLARTQLEHLRLPAGHTWSWTERYGPVGLTQAQGPWAEAVAEVRDAVADAADLERAHAVLEGQRDAPVEGTWTPERGGAETQGWGALAVLAGDLPDDPATPFDQACWSAEQAAWAAFLRTGELDPVLADSAVTGAGWRVRLRDAGDGWLALLHRGFAEHAAGETAVARELWERSAAAHPSAAALRALALTGDEPAVASERLAAVRRLRPQDPQLLLEHVAALLAAGSATEALDVLDDADPDAAGLPRVRLARARALVAAGRAEAAAEILTGDLEVPDLREGDDELGLLWADLQRLRGTDAPLPEHFDFRMH